MIELLYLKAIFVHQSNGQVLNLKADSLRNFMSHDVNYTYVDTYSNTCLNKLETCTSGISLVINVTVRNQIMNDKLDLSDDYGRIVLVSSGGDSPYNFGGFYLIQYSVRGENYLEFGIGLFKEEFKIQVLYSFYYINRLI